MSRPWSPQIALDAEAAHALVEAQMPDLAPARLEPFGVGWDNTAFLVNGTHVVRFPRRELGAACMEAEIRVMPAIAGRLPLPVTAPTHVGRPAAGFPWSFAAYPVLAGRPANEAALDDGQRTAAAGVLGRFLRALHAIGAREAAALGAGRDELGHLDLARRVPRVRENLARLAAQGAIDDATAFDEVIAAAAASRSPVAAALVHGDLDARHVLVDDAAAPCGVIDWGDVHLGDPALDLAIAWAFLPPAARGPFTDAYGDVDRPTWALARFRALHKSALLAVYGHEIGDGAVLEESLFALRNIGAT